MPESPFSRKVTGLILAGGRGRRMGGEDKGLHLIRGRPLVEYLIDALRPQTEDLMISANRNIERYRRYGFPVLPDADNRHAGPLAGILAGLTAIHEGYLLSVPCDAPLLSGEYRSRMQSALEAAGKTACVAVDGARLQPVHLLLHHSLAAGLKEHLASGQRRARDWVLSLNPAMADLSDHPEQFLNLNHPGDELYLRKTLEAMS